MADAPPIGSRVKVGRRVGVRVPSSIAQNDMRYEHTAYHMKRWDSDAPHHDANGWCQFTSKAEVKEYEAKNPRFKWNAD